MLSKRWRSELIDDPTTKERTHHDEIRRTSDSAPLIDRPITIDGRYFTIDNGRSATRDFWAIGPTAATITLRAVGFSTREAERLVRLKIRYERGAFRELTDAQRWQLHLTFLRWLAEHGRLDDGEPSQTGHNERSTV